jgi:predicted transposase YdaD
MKRDSLFYRLFAQSPTLLFDLLPERPEQAAAYRFDSVAVKEPKFEIDGVFLPPASDSSGTVYFCEVQMQKIEQLYERLFGESLLYFYRNRSRFGDWQAVVIYPSRSTEMVSKIMVYKFTNSSQEEIAAMLGTNVEDIRAFREAKEEERQAIAINMLKDNLPLEQIARLTGMTIAQLEKLQTES